MISSDVRNGSPKTATKYSIYHTPTTTYSAYTTYSTHHINSTKYSKQHLMPKPSKKQIKSDIICSDPQMLYFSFNICQGSNILPKFKKSFIRPLIIWSHVKMLYFFLHYNARMSKGSACLPIQHLSIYPLVICTNKQFFKISYSQESSSRRSKMSIYAVNKRVNELFIAVNNSQKCVTKSRI